MRKYYFTRKQAVGVANRIGIQSGHKKKIAALTTPSDPCKLEYVYITKTMRIMMIFTHIHIHTRKLKYSFLDVSTFSSNYSHPPTKCRSYSFLMMCNRLKATILCIGIISIVNSSMLVATISSHKKNNLNHICFTNIHTDSMHRNTTYRADTGSSLYRNI